SHDWGIGAVSYGSTLASAQTQMETDKWIGKVGLMSFSDYAKAPLASCATDNYSNSIPCGTSNYLHKTNEYYWTMTPYAGYSYIVFTVNTTGGLSLNSAFDGRGGRPAFYLTSNIQLTGDGTIGTPFEIKS
ncbi:MAG: DUF6273 domain-containing protein, partial [bacterium]|nr:DUF6273 domain-containing protein [bacterium]